MGAPGGLRIARQDRPTTALVPQRSSRQSKTEMWSVAERDLGFRAQFDRIRSVGMSTFAHYPAQNLRSETSNYLTSRPREAVKPTTSGAPSSRWVLRSTRLQRHHLSGSRLTNYRVTLLLINLHKVSIVVPAFKFDLIMADGIIQLLLGKFREGYVDVSALKISSISIPCNLPSL